MPPQRLSGEQGGRAAEPPRKIGITTRVPKFRDTPTHAGDDDEESSGKNMQKQPQHGTKKPQAGGWPKKRLKNDDNVTLFSGTAQRQRLMCVFSEIRVVP